METPWNVELQHLPGYQPCVLKRPSPCILGFITETSVGDGEDGWSPIWGAVGRTLEPTLNPRGHVCLVSVRT